MYDYTDNQRRYERVWSDMEKVIFIDKFLQFPKNFSKIASYITNRYFYVYAFIQLFVHMY
jgi:hypothetical protein